MNSEIEKKKEKKMSSAARPIWPIASRFLIFSPLLFYYKWDLLVSSILSTKCCRQSHVHARSRRRPLIPRPPLFSPPSHLSPRPPACRSRAPRPHSRTPPARAQYPSSPCPRPRSSPAQLTAIRMPDRGHPARVPPSGHVPARQEKRPTEQSNPNRAAADRTAQPKPDPRRPFHFCVNGDSLLPLLSPPLILP
jgi:hypothetical protein